MCRAAVKLHIMNRNQILSRFFEPVPVTHVGRQSGRVVGKGQFPALGIENSQHRIDGHQPAGFIAAQLGIGPGAEAAGDDFERECGRRIELEAIVIHLASARLPGHGGRKAERLGLRHRVVAGSLPDQGQFIDHE